MKIVVTGGAGFIGSHLVESLVNKQSEVVVIDNLTTGYLKNLDSVIEKIEFIQDDISKYNLSNLNDIDAVVHLAAQTSVPLSIEKYKPSSTVNLLGAINVIDFCKNNGVSLVYASSSAIYGELEIGDDSVSAVNLISPYAVDKYAMELYADVANKLYDVRSMGLRFFNVYGPRQDPSSPYSGVISIFIKRLLNNQPIQVNGGYQTRDFIYIKDVVLAINNSLDFLQKNMANNTVNVLTGSTCTIDELLGQLIAIMNKSPEIFRVPLPKGDPEKSGGSTGKMQKILGLSVGKLTDIQTGLKATVEYIANER